MVAWFMFYTRDGINSLNGKQSYHQILSALRLDVIGPNDLKFHAHLGSAAVDVPVKFQSDWKCLNPILAT